MLRDLAAPQRKPERRIDKVCAGCGAAFSVVIGHKNQLHCSSPCANRQRSLPLEQRFWSKVQKGAETDCWQWTANVSRLGYGLFHLGNGRHLVSAHRVAWTLTNGEIAAGLCVCHKCDNRPCCNPAHLFLGTHAENMQDAWDKGRQSHDRVRGEANPASKLTADSVRDIRKRYVAGENISQLSRSFGVARGTLYSLLKYGAWSHVDAK